MSLCRRTSGSRMLLQVIRQRPQQCRGVVLGGSEVAWPTEPAAEGASQMFMICANCFSVASCDFTLSRTRTCRFRHASALADGCEQPRPVGLIVCTHVDAFAFGVGPRALRGSGTILLRVGRVAPTHAGAYSFAALLRHVFVRNVGHCVSTLNFHMAYAMAGVIPNPTSGRQCAL